MRLAEVCEATNTPFPQFSSDEVVNYQVTEALVVRRRHEKAKLEQEAQRKQKMDEWKKGRPGS